MWGSGKIRDAQFTEKNLLILSNNSSSTSNCHSLRESCNRPSMYSTKKVLMKISMHKNIQFSIDYSSNFDPFSYQILYTTRAKKQNDPRHTTTSYWLTIDIENLKYIEREFTRIAGLTERWQIRRPRWILWTLIWRPRILE